jgi:FtsZ-binding cell division protein ZapB
MDKALDYVLAQSAQKWTDEIQLKDRDVDMLQKNLEELKEKNADLERRQTELYTQNAGLRTLNSDIKKRNAVLERRHTQLFTQYQESQTRNKTLEAVHSYLEKQEGELKTRNADLEGKLEESRLLNAATRSQGDWGSRHPHKGMLRDQPRHAFRLGPTTEKCSY